MGYTKRKSYLGGVFMWKVVREHYAVNKNGEVKSLPRKVVLYNGGEYYTNERIMKPMVNKKGYLFVEIDGKNEMIHRLVAEAFIPNPKSKPQVNHKDGIKTNNHDWNLEWATNAENIQHAFDTGLMKPNLEQLKANNEKLKKRVGRFSKDGELLEEYESVLHVSKVSDFKLSSVSKACRGNLKTYKGFVWKFI